MSRPPKLRTTTEHVIVLSRMSRSLEMDERLTPRRKKRLLQQLAQLMAELQKDRVP